MRYLAYIIVSLLAAAAFVLFVNRPQYVTVDAPVPSGFPAGKFPHDNFESLLIQYVDAAGRIDYASWHAAQSSVGQLESYLATVSRFSPENSPGRFATRSDELAYWMYGYNAYVIKSVLDHWPIDSVTDISAPIEAVKGLGFFYRQRFQFGGDYLSLLDVETNKIRKRYQDARIHFVLSCASGSCPIVRPKLPVGDALEEFLAAAATEFVSDSRNISVDHEARQVVLSTIFKWYREDFENELRKKGLPSNGGLVAYVQTIAREPLATELDTAGSYEVVFSDYDWAINSSE